MNAVIEPTTVTLRDVAGVLGISYQHTAKRAAREAWPFVAVSCNGGTLRRYLRDTLPDAVQTAFAERAYRQALRVAEQEATAAASIDAVREVVWADFQAAVGWRKRVAGVRMDAMMMMVRLRDEGLSLRRARIAVAEHYTTQGVKGCGVSALKRWGRTVKGKPRCDWMAYLLPEPKAARGCVTIHPGAWAAFKRDFLRVEKPGAESCYRRLQRQAIANPEWGALPSLDTFERRLRAEVSRPQILLRRDGEEAMMAAGPKIARSRTGLAALERVNSDGHTFDVAVSWPDGSIARPVIVGWQDIASGKVLSWRVGKSETSDLVRLSFCDMVRDYGIPAHAYLDNGRAYASKKNTGGVPTRHRYKVKPEDPDGVITRLGTAVHWVTPYNGKAKPIERTWRDFAHEIAKRPEFAGAYLGNNPTAKPENYGSRAVPHDEFMRVVADGIAEHNAREGRRAEVCEGRSFDATFAAGYAVATIKRATAQQLALLLLASDVVTVDARTAEVRLAGNRYWAECLPAYMGQRIELRFDPAALQSDVHAVALDGSYIGAVPCIAAIGWETSDHMREGIRAQADWKRAQKAVRAAAVRVEAANAVKDAPSIAPAATPPPAATALFVPKRKAVNAPRVAGGNSAELSEETRNVLRLWSEGWR